ncbi:MAG: hypothetical protein AAFY71_00145 [Bacteroidota bacterium]
MRGTLELWQVQARWLICLIFLLAGFLPTSYAFSSKELTRFLKRHRSQVNVVVLDSLVYEAQVELDENPDWASKHVDALFVLLEDESDFASYVAEAHAIQGWIYLADKEINLALRSFYLASDIYKSLGADLQLARIHQVMANCFLQKKRNGAAISFGLSAFPILKEAEQHAEAASLAVVLAESFLSERRNSEADHFADQAIYSFRLIKDSISLVKTYFLKARTLDKLRNQDDGIWWGLESIRIAENLKVKIDQIEIHNFLASMYMEVGEMTASNKAIKKAISLQTEENNPEQFSRSFSLLGDWYVKKNILWRAERSYKEAIDRLDNSNASIKTLSALYHKLAYVNEKSGNEAAKKLWLFRELDLRDSILNHEFQHERIWTEEALRIASKQEYQESLIEKSSGQEQTIRKQRLTILFGIGAIVLVLFLLTSVLNSRLKLRRALELQREQKEEIAFQAKEIQLLNSALEKKVADRTRELSSKNEKLQSFAFDLSHRVRAPLATIMGLITVMRIVGPDEASTYQDKIEKSAQELDEVIKETNKSIS